MGKKKIRRKKKNSRKLISIRVHPATLVLVKSIQKRFDSSKTLTMLLEGALWETALFNSATELLSYNRTNDPVRKVFPEPPYSEKSESIERDLSQNGYGMTLDMLGFLEYVGLPKKARRISKDTRLLADKISAARTPKARQKILEKQLNLLYKKRLKISSTG